MHIQELDKGNTNFFIKLLINKIIIRHKFLEIEKLSAR